MYIFFLLFQHFTKYLLLAFFFISTTQASDKSSHLHSIDPLKTTLKGGWYLWDPYQYLENANDINSVTGLDIELQRTILKKAGFETFITPTAWKQHQEDLKSGEKDYAVGAFYTKKRAEYSYVSLPYRFEEDSFFTLKKSAFSMNFKNVKNFIDHVKKNNLRIGVVDGFRYADKELNNFIDDLGNQNFIVKSATDNQNLILLVNHKIDGFLADRIVGATIVWREKFGSMISEKRLNSKAPIFMLLSKKTISREEFKNINDAIKSFTASPEYSKIISWYLYPTLLLETTDSDWFFLIEMIGIAAFAISGLIVAYHNNASLFGTFLLALAPAFGGGILRDIIAGRYPIWFMQAHFYILLVIYIILVGFAVTKFLRSPPQFLQKTRCFKKNEFSFQVLDKLLIITDAIGLSAFTVIGVLVSLIAKADPLWLWGPFFAFLTGAGGGILRDILVNKVSIIQGSLYSEISIFWGFIFSHYLISTTYDVDPLKIELSVIFTLVMTFITRIVVVYYQIPNIFMNHSRKN